MDTSIIDFVAIDKEKNVVNLIISDDLKWDDPQEHIDALQEKILNYVTFIETGKFNQKYPNLIGVPQLIRVVFEHDPIEEGLDFVRAVQATLKDTGCLLEYTIY